MKAFDDNKVGMDDKEVVLHDKRWYVYMYEKLLLLNGGYSVEVSGSYRKKLHWEVIDDHVVEEPKDNYDIGL